MTNLGKIGFIKYQPYTVVWVCDDNFPERPALPAGVTQETLRSILSSHDVPPQFKRTAREIAYRAYRHGTGDLNSVQAGIDELRDSLGYWHGRARALEDAQ